RHEQPAPVWRRARARHGRDRRRARHRQARGGGRREHRAPAERLRQDHGRREPAALPARRRGDSGGSIRAAHRVEVTGGRPPFLSKADIDNSLVQLDPGLFIWTILTVLVLLTLLAKFGWRPLLAALDSRQNAIKKSLDDAQQARQELERLNQAS